MKFIPVLALALSTLLAPAVARAAENLPSNSLYRIPPIALVDQVGHSFSLASLAGEPRLIGMFYASCHMMCPLEIELIKAMEKTVAEAGGAPIPVVLVSFDTAHDNVAALARTADDHDVKAPGFELTRAEKGDVGMLGGVLGVAWRAAPGGGFQHNVVVALLDRQGRIVATNPGDGRPDRPFIDAILAQERQAAR